MTTSNLIEAVGISRYQTYEEPVCLRERTHCLHGTCYRISNKLVAKVPHGVSCIGREMKIALMLHATGISVPRPYAWDFINVPAEYEEPQKAFIMEYIEGQDVDKLDRKLRETLLEKANEEYKKASEKGFSSWDWIHGRNQILTPSNKIVLVDFSDWMHPNVPDYVNPETVFKEEVK